MQNEQKIIGATAGCIGLAFGAALGAALGFYAAYSIAELFSANHEKQAYLTLPIIPALALLGGLTVSATAIGVIFRKKAMFVLGGIGWALLLVVLIKGLVFNHISRPAQLRVENRSNVTIEAVFIGSDFRRSQRLGNISPKEFSKSVTVDLDNPTSYNQIEGRAAAGYVRNRGSNESLPDGNYTYVVSGTVNDFNYAIVKD